MKLFIFLLALISPFAARGQQNETFKNRISAQVSISMEETYEYSAGYHYLFCDYVGLGANVGAWSVNSSSGLLGEDNESKAQRQNAFIKPSLLLKTPSLFSIKQCSFNIECEPGIMFSTRQKVGKWQSDMETYKEWKTDCISFNCAFGLAVEYKNLNLSAYYSLSNLDVNRDYNLERQDNYKKKLVESVGLKIGLYF